MNPENGVTRRIALDARELVRLVRRGFAATTAEQAQVMRGCADVEVVGGTWVPRWALEAATALQDAGYSPEKITSVFAAGRSAVLDELQFLVRAGRRARVLEPRRAWSPLPFDQATRTVLIATLQQHRAGCDRCGATPCADARDLLDELELLFPADRRAQPRP